MAQTAITIRIDEQDKGRFTELCSEFGMSVNTAVNIFVKKVIDMGAIPFNIGKFRESKEDRVTREAKEAWRSIRMRAEASNEPEMTLDEINTIIAEVRAERAAKEAQAEAEK